MRRLAAILLTLVVLPAATASAGAWVTESGKTFVSLTLQHQRTEERYFLDGRRIPYFFEGVNTTTAVFVDLRWGLPGRLEAVAQMGLFRIAFDDLADDRVSTGPGDLRLGLRWQGLDGPLVVTPGLTVKLPTGEFVNDAENVPVGEGQVDVEATLELGRSLWPRPGYVTALLGYRWRTENAETGIDRGNELFWSVDAGYRIVGRLGLKALARGLRGVDGSSFGIALPSLRRDVVFLEPALTWRLGEATALEVSVPFTLSGRNYPAGAVLGVGFYTSF